MTGYKLFVGRHPSRSQPLVLAVLLGLVTTATAESRTFKVVQNSDWRFSQKITLPDFPTDSRLLAHVHVIPKGDPWDRNGRVVLNTPKGQVDLTKFITGFGGETRHTVDVTNLRTLLKGEVTISGDIPRYVGNWGMDFHIEEVRGGNTGAPTLWATPVVSSGTKWGHGAFAKGKQSFTVEVPSGPFEKIWLTYYATGHGGGNGKTCCEFKKRTHRVWVNGNKVLDTVPWRTASKKFRKVNPRSGRFTGDRWSSDFARSGWLPGDRVHPFVLDVTGAIAMGRDGKSKIEFEILGDLSGGHFTVSSFLSGAAPSPGLVFDKKIGHYRDLSYEALTDEGMTWDERARMFGGETVHYGKLTDEQRGAKEKELAGLLARLDAKLVGRCEADIRKWLDEQALKIPPAYAGRDVYKMRAAAVMFFRAHEIFGDKKYLEAGVQAADRILKTQWSRGHWPWPGKGQDFVRVQDGTTTEPFWIMLYAHKLTGDQKYFSSARCCADVLLSIQRKGGGWPDQWSFSGRRSGNTGVVNGTSFNDNGTNAPFRIMVMMYHLTGDRKYVAGLAALGTFIVKANIGEGDVVGWAEQYNDAARPVRARGYEIELPYPRALTRATGPLLIWLYLMTGDESHIDLVKRAYAWHEHVRKRELDPAQLEAWKLMAGSWTRAGRPMHYRPGWPDAWLPDGSNWGRVTAFKMIPWFPVSGPMKKKYGGMIHRSETDGGFPGNCGYLAKWGKDLSAGGKHPECSMGFSHAARGNSLSQVRRALLEHKRGGHKGLLKYYSQPTKYTDDEYLQARVDAAKRVLDGRNLELAADPEKKGIGTLVDPGGLLAQKGRWHGGTLVQGTRISKWGAAYGTSGKYGSVAWYQWQLVYDAMLARGKIDADAAARGGRGVEHVASMNHLDSWDVLGEWGMHVHEVEHLFTVPLKAR